MFRPLLPLLVVLAPLVQSPLAPSSVGPRPAAPSDWPPARAGHAFSFPRDHGSHPDFRTEWWYFTGNLSDPAGRRFGFKLTFFRSRPAPPGSFAGLESPLLAEQIHAAHFAISDVRERRLRSAQRIGREGFAQARAATATFDVALHGWRGWLGDDGVLRLVASDREITLELELRPTKPPVIHGRDGVHRKADDPEQTSHYVSFTRLQASGTVVSGGERHVVQGEAWMDHEWGSARLGMIEAGWDWFGLALEGGEELMVYQLRRDDGSANPAYHGSLVTRDGRVEELGPADYRIAATGDWQSPHSGARYPMGWRIAFPGHDGELVVTPEFDDQEMLMARTTGVTYWEGAVRVTGRWRGAPAKGAGYAELVGYAPRQRSAP